MIAPNALEQTTDTETSAKDTTETVATVALDQVNGGWLYSPYASPYAYANPYMAAARYEARLEHRVAWMERRAANWWGY